MCIECRYITLLVVHTELFQMYICNCHTLQGAIKKVKQGIDENNTDASIVRAGTLNLEP